MLFMRDSLQRRSRRKSSGRGGFTLIEVLIAGMVLTIGIVGVVNQIPMLMKWEIMAMERVRSALYTQSRIDYMIGQTYGSIGATGSGDYTDIFEPVTPNRTTHKWNYTRTEILPGIMSEINLTTYVDLGGDTSGRDYGFYILAIN